jgi:hypothetical protein
MEFSVPGLIGALVGLAIGYVDYRVVGGVVVARLRKLDRSSGPAEREEFERKIRILRAVLFAMTVLAFPIVGYWLGITVAGR